MPIAKHWSATRSTVSVYYRYRYVWLALERVHLDAADMVSHRLRSDGEGVVVHE